MIETVIKRFSQTTLLNALQYKGLSKKEFIELIDDVDVAISHIKKEYNKLVNQVEPFLNCYAPDDRYCFNTALKTLHALRRSLSKVKCLVAKFTPTQHRIDYYHLANNRAGSVYKYSILCGDVCQTRINFGEDLLPEETTLYHKMTFFLGILYKAILLCKDVIDRVEQIRKDPEFALYLYNKFRDEVLGTLDHTLLISQNHPLLLPENNPVIKCRQQYPSIKAFAPHGYHLGNRELGTFAVIAEEYERQQQSDSTRYELELFGNDELVRKCREVIKHFDKLMPKEYTGKKIPAKYVAFFFRYIGLGDKQVSKAYQYFSRIYDQEEHNLKLTGYAAVSNAYSEVRLGENSEFDDFVERIIQTYGNCSYVNIAYIG